MGQRQVKSSKQEVTLQQVQQSIQIIFDDQLVNFNPLIISVPIRRILINLQENIPAQKTQSGFVLNLQMIKVFYHKKFLYSMAKMINLLMDKLQDLMQKNVMMVQKQEWQFCLNVANFVIFFTDDKLIRMVETVSIRNDLSQETRKYIQIIERQGGQFQATTNLIDKFSFNEIERIEKCLRISMNQMIMMRMQVITRSEQTLKTVQRLEQACFILYLKALYSPEHSQSIINKAKHPQFLKSNLNIAHYFLGKGSDLGKASVYQSSILFLFNLIQKNKSNLKQFKCLPSHLFRNLPIISQISVYDFIMNVCLFSLSYIKEGVNHFSRFSFNRLMTFKLLDLVIKEVKVSSPQITYYLEEICLQTRIGMIQRSFVTDLVQKYMNLIHQHNKMMQIHPPVFSQKIKPVIQQPPLISKYQKQTHVSQILTKYLQSGKQDYNVKYSNKRFKITTVDIVTELQNDQSIMQTQFKIICEKYIYEVILNKRVIYQYNDRQIWSEILPHILEDKDLSGDQICNQENQNKSHMHRQKSVGQTAVMSQTDLPTQLLDKALTKPDSPAHTIKSFQHQQAQQRAIYNQAKPDYPKTQQKEQNESISEEQKQQQFEDVGDDAAENDKQNQGTLDQQHKRKDESKQEDQDN